MAFVGSRPALQGPLVRTTERTTGELVGSQPRLCHIRQHRRVFCVVPRRQRQVVESTQPVAPDAQYRQYLRPPKRITSSDWLNSLRGIPKSKVLWRIRHPLVSLTAIAFVVSFSYALTGIPSLPTLQVHSLLGSGLSLLLVFRTNSAYQRFQEGRKIWNDILDISRDIALSVSLYKEEAGMKRIRIIRSSLQAFPFAMQEHVRAKKAYSMQERLQKLLHELGEKGRIVQPTNRPLNIVHRLLNVINSIPNQGDKFTNRERVWLLGMVNKLQHTVGRCERLVQTPVPLSYARHTTRFVTVWTLTLPFALVGCLRWLTAPVVFFVAWVMFGILEIGHMIEDPFRRTIELTPICEAIETDCARALKVRTSAQDSAGSSSGTNPEKLEPSKGQSTGVEVEAKLFKQAKALVATQSLLDIHSPRT